MEKAVTEFVRKQVHDTRCSYRVCSLGGRHTDQVGFHQFTPLLAICKYRACELFK